MTSESPPKLMVRVYIAEGGDLNMRSEPTTASAIVTTVPNGTTLTPLEPDEVVRAKVGQHGEWLHVGLDDGREVYAAAWYLELAETGPDQPPEDERIAVTADLTGTERQVALTWNRLGGLLQRQADRLEIDPGVAVAVLRVESGGRPFGPDGRMIIRFENHIFHSRWGEDHPEAFAHHFAFNPNPGQLWKDHRWRPSPDGPWRSFHGDQNSEWEVLDFACTLDDTAARLSISMGGPQIMGFNYAALGYASVQQMFDAFAASERHQVDGFFGFVRSRGQAAIQALQSSDFNLFARFYNGFGQAEHYGSLIRQAYEAYRRLRAIPFAAPRAVALAAAPAPVGEPDDLQRVLGIGPKTAARLQAEGIRRFEQLAALDTEQLRGLLGGAARYARWLASWPAQARLADWGDRDALEAFQVRLRS
ncbi:MAG: N-acetylmuramidase domain-containing protein [Anaerolineae bacterium]